MLVMCMLSVRMLPRFGLGSGASRTAFRNSQKFAPTPNEATVNLFIELPNECVLLDFEFQ